VSRPWGFTIVASALVCAGFWVARNQSGVSIIGMGNAAQSIPAAAPVVSAPTPVAPATPTAPVIAARDLPPAAGVSDAVPAPPDAAVSLSPEAVPQGWKDEPSAQEQPVIEVTNLVNDGVPAVSLFTGNGRTFQLDLNVPVATLQVPPGDYYYELRSSLFSATGTPDMTGHFRCRRYRKYSVKYVVGDYSPDASRSEDFGDPN